MISVPLRETFSWLKRQRTSFDFPRLVLFAVAMACVALVAQYLNIQGVPLIHAEVLLLAPWLHTRLGRGLAIFSILIGVARIVQGIFGFDQLFVATELLLRNMAGFPAIYSLAWALAIGAFVLFLVLGFQFALSRRRSIPLGIGALLLTLMLCLKAAEDHTKKNLIGTSFGNFVGQLRFANMFNDAYRTPGPRPEQYPGLTGAKLALQINANYWLIVVESLGSPNDAVVTRELFKPFQSDGVTMKYAVTLGSVPSVGSTIHGEIRALCDGFLVDGLFGLKNEHCVPRMLAAHGYRSEAVHANKSSVYGRDIWYPRVGFSRIHASDTEKALNGERTDRWGTVLDATAIEWTARTRFVEPRSFAYLLTVSTHLPAELLPGALLDRQCEDVRTTKVCIHLANLRSVMQNIADAAAKLDNTVVVLMGDHPPPFVSIASEGAFSSTEVPYLMLSPRVK